MTVEVYFAILFDFELKTIFLDHLLSATELGLFNLANIHQLLIPNLAHNIQPMAMPPLLHKIHSPLCAHSIPLRHPTIVLVSDPLMHGMLIHRAIQPQCGAIDTEYLVTHFTYYGKILQFGFWHKKGLGRWGWGYGHGLEF